MNFNKAIILGNLTADPEMRMLPSGQAVTSFRLATNRIYNDQSGNKQQTAEFHNVVTFGRLADICARYLTKGGLALIEGRIQTRSWTDQSGIKKFKTEIVAENLQLGPRKNSENATVASNNGNSLGKQLNEEIPIIEVDDSSVPTDSLAANTVPEIKNIIDENEIEVKNIPF